MPDALPVYVRVKDKATKHEYSVVASAVDPEHQDVLDKPATNCDGTPLAPKHYVALKSLSSPQVNTHNGQKCR